MKPTSLQARIVELKAILAGLLRRKALYEIAISALGTDASPADLAPDELGCAETVSNLIKRVLPHFPIVTGTWALLDVLAHSSNMVAVAGEPIPGDIMLFATGTGLGIFPGHVGIVAKGRTVMSNDSRTGQFMQNYTVDSFRRRYAQTGGFPEHIFRIIK